MAQAKIAISLDERMLRQLDGLVAQAVFPNRSQAVQVAVQEKLARIEQGRLARECAKLDLTFETAMAEEGFAEDASAGPHIERRHSLGRFESRTRKRAGQTTSGINSQS